MSLKEYWINKRKESANVANNGRVKFTVQGSRLQVICPDSDLFMARAKELGGMFKDRANVWSFPLVSQRLVKSLVVECFGEESIQ